MKKTCTILAVFLVLFQSSIKTIIVIKYYIDFNYIVENICENRANPELHCDGKCYLNKQLAAEEKNEKALAAVLKEKAELFACDIAMPVLPACSEIVLRQGCLYQPGTASGHRSSVFHPPPVSPV